MIHTFPTGERELRLADGDPTFPARLKLGPHPVNGRFQAQVAMTVDGEEQGAGVYLTAEQLAEMQLFISELIGGLRIEVVETLGQPTTCQIWRDGALVFDGQDKSALLKEAR